MPPPVQTIDDGEISPTTYDQQTDNGEPVVDEEFARLFEYERARIRLDRLTTQWGPEISLTEGRRKVRKIEIDSKALREAKIIRSDELLIPVRTVNTNIEREKPPFISYLKTSRRLAIFRPIDNPDTDVARLEKEYSEGMRYIGYEVPHFKVLDGGQTHGWDTCEVIFDPSKPLHVGIEHVGHENLIFDREAVDLQHCAEVIRVYKLTLMKLEEFVVKFQFDAAQVQILKDTYKETDKELQTITVYKRFFKYQGQVFVSWFSDDKSLTDWLKPPVPLSIGIQQKVTKLGLQEVPGIDPLTGSPTMQQQEVPYEAWEDAAIDIYPLFMLPYSETEEAKIFDHKGRAYLDGPKQEAQTALLSAFINGANRASNVYGSPAADDNDGRALKTLDISLEAGTVVSKPFQFWNTPYPDPIMLGALQYMDVANTQETGQLSFAVQNRKDSRKTAKEISNAENQESQLNTVQLTLYSTYIRSVYTFAWKIVQSQAMQGLIKFLLIPKQRPQLMNGMPVIDPMTMQPVMETYWENNYDVIGQGYDIAAAGDVDYIERQEKIQSMERDWPVVQQTPLALRFLSDMMKLKYPDDGENYAKILEQGDIAALFAQLLLSVTTVLEGLIKTPEVLATIDPSAQAQLQQILMESKSALANYQAMQQQKAAGASGGPQQQTQVKPPPHDGGSETQSSMDRSQEKAAA